MVVGGLPLRLLYRIPGVGLLCSGQARLLDVLVCADCVELMGEGETAGTGTEQHTSNSVMAA